MQEMQETQVLFLDREDPLEKEMVTSSNILVWKVLWTEESSRQQSMRSQSWTWVNTHTWTETLPTPGTMGKAEFSLVLARCKDTYWSPRISSVNLHQNLGSFLKEKITSLTSGFPSIAIPASRIHESKDTNNWNIFIGYKSCREPEGEEII